MLNTESEIKKVFEKKKHNAEKNNCIIHALCKYF